MSENRTQFHLESREWFRAKGPDALRFLNGMWTCDFKRAATHALPSTAEGLLLNTKGKTISSAVFLCENKESFLFSVPSPNGAKTIEALDKYLVADQVELEFLNKAPFKKVVSVLSDVLPSVEKMALASPYPGSKDLLFEAKKESWGYLIPRGGISPGHYELWIESEEEVPTLLNQAKALSEQEWTLCRIRAGLPLWGVDFTEETLPLEYPFSSQISFHKGCYLGQEVVARGTYRGRVNKSFARFSAKGPLKNDFVYINEESGEKPVGKISSCVGSDGLGLIRLNILDGSHVLYQKSENSSQKIEILKTEVLIELKEP